jgi:hypothetical protein
MSRGAQTFKLADLSKAVKAAGRAGLEVSSYEIDKAGTIVVKIGKTGSSAREIEDAAALIG